MVDLFYECKNSNVSSYADDTTPYSCATDILSVALELQASAYELFRWFKNNRFKANPGKSHILISTKKPEIVSTDEIPLATSSHKKRGIKFENHITELCLKVIKKLNALSYIKFHVIRKTQDINKNICRIAIQSLSLDMDASF